jgi:N-acyl-D-amino-acid deacylase
MNKGMTRRDFLRSSAQAGLFLGLTGSKAFSYSTGETFDLIVKNGTVIDGIADRGFKADIGILGERILQIGNLQKAIAKTVLDASGRIVSPGFIDIHTHTDTEILINPRAESKIRQGVTTELGGNCGSSPFPMKQPLSKGARERAEKAGISIDWTDLEGFHRAVAAKGTAINHATLLGQGTLRGFVIGDDQREPTPSEMKRMKELVAQTMRKELSASPPDLNTRPADSPAPMS